MARLVGFQSDKPGGKGRQMWINPRFVVEVYEGDDGGVVVLMVGGRWLSVDEPLPKVLAMLRGKEDE